MSDFHTPEPWSFGEGTDREWYIHGHNQDWIAETVPSCPGTAESNARRIVACVNACAGVSTACLETIGGGIENYITLKKERDNIEKSLEIALEGNRVLDRHRVELSVELEKTKKQRDELLKALERAKRKLSAYVGVCPGDKELTEAVLPMVQAAIGSDKELTE